jgi:hypothetical protein
VVSDVLSYLYPNSVPLRDWVVQADEAGTRLVRWNSTLLGPQPTAQQLADAEASAGYLSWKSARDADALASASERQDLKASAAQAVADIDAYLLIADGASNAQVRAEVKAIDQRLKRVIKVLARLV